MPLLSQKRDGGMRVHFNRDGTLVVKFDAHPSTIIDDEAFGRLIKMKNVFARQPLTSCCLKNLLIFPHIDKLGTRPWLSYLLSFLSFSWRQYVLHLHHSLSVRRPGHLRGSCAYIANGSCLVRPLLFTSILSFIVKYKERIDGFCRCSPWRMFGTFTALRFGRKEHLCPRLVGPAVTLWT